MTFCKLRSALIIVLSLCVTDAFAIDQIILKNGSVVEGKILSDVPNRHVDIELVNGSKKRYAQADVASVERDVPSSSDRHMAGNSQEIYVGAVLGGFTNLALTSSTVKFVWGGRLGINVTQLGDFSKLAFGLAYSNITETDAATSISATLGELTLQALFRKVANTGFYFGPQLGLAFISASVGGVTYISTSEFEYGAVVGYDYYFSDGFSIGPEVQINHFTANTPLKFGLTGTIHF